MFNSAGLGGGYTMTFTGNDLSALLSGAPVESLNGQYSADSMWEGDDSEKEALHNEKSAMRYYLLKTWKLPGPMGSGRTKNSEDSIECRKQGNEFYNNSKMPDDVTHEKVWRLYTQSIALAPNGSAELALGYGNRSALLFHLQKYEDCIKDCDRAIEMATASVVLKGKLICRKTQSIAFLNKNSAQRVCDDALEKLSELTITEDIKKQFIDKIHKIVSTLKTSNSPKQISEPANLSELVDMKYQKEAPYASKSVKINYSKQWGRHVTATKDIKPGDIVAIPDNFCTLLNPVGMYLFCSNCAQPAWSSIPCKHCIFDIYCSEECMSKAWDKYHKYECAVYPYIWDMDDSFTNGQKAIRLLLIMIHKAGGIQKLKKIVNDVEHCKDRRTKGFSSDGIFLSDHSSSMYSHMCGPDKYIDFSRIREAALHLYLLVGETDLFGIKVDAVTADMLVVDDMLFVGALLTRIDSVLEKHLVVLTHEFGKVRETKVQYAISFNAFNSLFNHSCDPNIELVSVKNNKTVIYAKRPIKEGEQLFVSYRGMRYLWATKELRQKHLQEVYGFKCSCLPCSENWSNICVPKFNEIFDVTPGLMAELKEFFKLEMETEFRKTISEKDIQLSLRSAMKIKLILEILSTNLTAYCSDYNWYERELMELYTICFGDWTFDMSHKCINA